MGQNEGREGWEKMETKNRKLRPENTKIGTRKSKKMDPKINKNGVGRAGSGGEGRGKWEEKE
jgi:hypothetical protein